jgi:YidC/Oxa1 family membrane protein insertase
MLVTANIFQPLIDVFEAVIKFFHNTVGVPWGWSIVLLTVTIRAVLIPLTVKQFHSMRRLQMLQPQLKEIQGKYKEDKQRQQQELMKFYKENNVNPLASCLPMVAQLPVFISLFYMLRKNLRADICPQLQPHHIVNGHNVINTALATKACGPHGGASFLFVQDLTNKASGGVLIALIILYVGTQVGSTLMMRTPQMDKTQQNIMLLLPLVFVLFIIGFPAGVIVYWITTNTWTMLQQFVIKRRLGPPVVAVATAGGGGAGGGGGPRSGGGGGNKPRKPGPKPEDSGSENGSGGGGLGALRDKLKPSAEPVPVTAGRSRSAPPPQSPRKKKKRSGRRR